MPITDDWLLGAYIGTNPGAKPAVCRGVNGRNRECQFADQVCPPVRYGEHLHILLSFD